MAAHSKLKRSPDASVAMAVQQVIKQQKSKRMMMFGLRNLSELCSPDKTKYKENSIAAMVEGIVPVITASVQAYGDDEDVIVACMKILKGISDQLVEERNADLIEQLKTDGGIEAGSVVITNSATISEDQILSLSLGYFANLEKLGIRPEPKGFAAALVQAVNKKRSPALSTQIFKMLAQIADNSEGVEILSEKMAVDKILEVLVVLNPTASEAAMTAEAGLAVIQKLSEKNRATTHHMDSVIKTLDLFKSKKSVVDRGSAILVSMLGPDELKKCLDALATAKPGSRERQDALTTLTSMSYISSYAEAVVKAGGVKLLCDAVEASAHELSGASSDPQLIKGLYGACKMLRRIADNPAHVNSIAEAGGIEAIINALAATIDLPTSAAACMETLIPMARVEPHVLKIKSLDGYKHVLNTLTKNVSNRDAALAGVALLAVTVGHESVLEDLCSGGMVAVVSNGVSHHNNEPAYLVDCVVCLKQGAKYIKDFSEVSKGHESVVRLLSTQQADNTALALSGLELLQRLLPIPSGLAALQTGETADAVLNVMLQYPDNSNIQQLGKVLLGEISTEADVKRCLADLDRSIQNAKSNPERALRCLAAVNGLSQVDNLKPIFEQRDAARALLKGIAAWVQTPPFAEQQRIIKAAAMSIESLKVGSSGMMDATIRELLETAQLQQLRTLSEKQNLGDTSLLDIIRCCSALCAAKQISKEAVPELLEAVTKLSWKYQDLRRVQVHCIDMMTDLAMIEGGGGAKILVESGGLKNVIGYLLKVVIYEDVQAAGLRLLAACIKQDASLVEPIKFAGGIDVCKSVQGTHATSPQIKSLLPSVAGALMPSDFLDQDIKKAIEALNHALLDEQPAKMQEAMQALCTFVTSPEGVRSAVSARIGVPLKSVASYCNSDKISIDVVDMASDASKLIRNLCEARVGVSHMSRCGGLTMLGSLLDVLTQKVDPDISPRKEGIEANLQAQRNLMRSGATSTDDTVFMKRQIARFCLLLGEYPEERRIGGAAAAALAIVPTAQLTKTSDFDTLLKKTLNTVATGNDEAKITALTAIAQLLDSPEQDRANLLENQRGVPILFQCLEANADNIPVRDATLQALAVIGRHSNLRKLLVSGSSNGEAAAGAAIETCHRILTQNPDDVDLATTVVSILNHLATRADRQLLGTLGVTDLSAELLAKHPDNKALTTALGELLGKAGAGETIEVLMAQIVSTVDEKAPGWQKSLDLLCSKLAVLLPADVDDVPKAFAKTPAMANALSEALEKTSDDSSLPSSIALVTRRLIERFETSSEYTRFGAKAVEPRLLPALAKLLGNEAHAANQNPQFLLNSYRALTLLLNDADTRAACLEASKTNVLVPKTYKRLEVYKKDPNVTGRLLQYLAAMASTSDKGLDNVIQGFPSEPQKGTAENQLATKVLADMHTHRLVGPVAVAGTELLAAVALRHPDLMSLSRLKQIGAIAEATPEGLAAWLSALARFAGNDALRVQSMDEIKQAEDRFRRLYEHPTTTATQKAALAIAYANLMRGLAEAGEVDELKRTSALDTLMTMLETYSNDPEVLESIIRALNAMAEMDQDFNAVIARNTPSILMDCCAPTIKGSPVLCEATLRLLYTLGCNEGNGRLLSSTVGFDSFMTTLGMQVGELPQAQAEEMTKMLNSFKYMVEQDNPQALTLKQVYKKWLAKKNSGETLEIAESVLVMQQFDFVCDYTEEYSRAELKGLETELGDEFRHGCLCFSLLHEYPLNTSQCLEKGEARILVQAIRRQTLQEVAQCAINTARDLCAHAEAAVNFGEVPQSKETSIEAVSGFQPGSMTPEEADEMMIPRLELIERTAVTRQHFDGTNCMPVLIDVWNGCDAHLYTQSTLRHVFRAMRRIVNETWVQPILENQVPRRLVEFISKENQDLSLLPDVLFLVGALATVPQIKTLLGEIRGIEACLDLLHRCLKNTAENTSPVQTNTCLALANITIGHGPNIAKFTAAKGIETNVEVMRRSMAGEQHDYDAANAAAVLMCNLCYRRDDVKQLFGSKGGPSMVTMTVRRYDGSDSKSAFRCLGSLLKAIGNLALYTPNVDIFLAEQVESTFAHLYSNSEFLPDELLEVSLRTMSNLVLENTDEAMEKFGAVLIPLLTMLQQARRESVRMLALAFEVLGNLCRLPQNAATFADKNGIETTLRVANTHTDARLSAAVIHLLAVQVNNPKSMDVLLKAGVFKFLSNLFESQAAAEEKQPDVCVAGLRCARRLLIDKRAGDVFVEAEGPNAILHLMHSSPNISMIQLDSYKIFLALLTMYPPPPPPQGQQGNKDADDDAEWDADVADEGVLGLIHRMERPPGPRSWESIKFNSDMVRRLVISICACLLEEGHARQVRLQRCGLGLLAYFACEKLPDAVEGFYAGAYNSVVRQALATFPADLDIVKTCCYIIVNVSYVSDADDYKIVAKDKLLRTTLEDVVSRIPKKNTQMREFCILTGKLLADRKDPDPKKFESIVEWEYPLQLTQWNMDPYPNGVQDLSAEVKKTLREGGRAKIVIEPKLRHPFWWKSSQDLSMLQWKTTDETIASYSHQISISRIRTLAKGLATPLLEAASAKDRKVDDKVCIVIIGPPTEDAPSGLELNLKLKSKKERDALWNLISEWRDAATYGI